MSILATTTPGPLVQPVSDAISQGVGDATSVVTGNLPAVFAVTGLFVAWKVGRKLMSRIG
jgi:hypothetical protein